MKRILLIIGLMGLISCGSDKKSTSATLAGCGSNNHFFTAAILDDENFAGIAPLGTINPPHHTFPTAHTYPDIGRAEQVPLYSPGDLTVTSIVRTTYVVSDFRQGHRDYSVHLKPCEEVLMTLGHVTALEPQLDALVSSQSCSTRSTPNETVEECFATVSVPVSAGQKIGEVGLDGQFSGFDWGISDTRVDNFFVNPRRNDAWTMAACPVDYYVPGSVKNYMQSKFYRDVTPVCGEVTYDVEGTIQGVWVRADTPADAYQEGYGITFGKGNDDPSIYQFALADIGTALDQRTANFTPQNDGLVDRNFVDVTVDGQIYCYDFMPDRVLVRLDGPENLTLEAQVGLQCSDGGFNFTGASLNFIR